jgi:hypothetical protein
MYKIKTIAPKKFASKDLDTNTGMKNIFLTASPYLI